MDARHKAGHDERGALFRRHLGQALERIAHDPDRVAPTATVASLGSRTVVAMAAMMAQVLATSILRAVVTQRAR